MLVLSLFCMSIGYSNAWKVTGNIVLTAFPRQQQINNRNDKCNVRVYKPRLLKDLNFNGAFSFFWWYGWPKSPDDTLPQLIFGRECVCALIFFCILSAGVCACIRWAHSAGPVLWPYVPVCDCVCIQRSGEPGLFSCSFLIMGVYTF